MTGDERMRKILLALFCVIVCVSPGLCDVPIDESNFPDPNFREWLKYYDCHRVDKDGCEYWHEDYRDGILDDEETGRIYEFIYHSQEEDGRISTLEGIKYLTSLNTISVTHQDIEELDVSGMKNLQRLYFGNSFTRYYEPTLHSYDINIKVNAEGCTSLYDVSFYGAREVSLRGCSSIKSLWCDGFDYWINEYSHETLSVLDSLDIMGCDSLEELTLQLVRLSSLNLHGHENLHRFNLLDDDAIKAVDLSGCTSLDYVWIDDCNKLISIDFGGCDSLRTADCCRNAIESINLEGCTNLRYLNCERNKLEAIDLTQCPNLEELYINNNKLTSLNARSNTALKNLYCSDNLLTYLDLSSNKALEDAPYTGAQPGVQTIHSLKAAPYGKYWRIDFADYMPAKYVKNVSFDTLYTFSFNSQCSTVSYDIKKGLAIIDSPYSLPPTRLSYQYETHSPLNHTMYVTLEGHETYPHVYGGRLSYAIHGMDSEGYFRYDNYGTNTREYFTEADDAYFSPEYEAIGFTVDGNSRLILRVESLVSGSVTFSVPQSLGATLETLSRDKSSSSITFSTTETYPGHFSATAVLIAPESFPSSYRFPSDDFKLTATFTDYSGNITAETRTLKICAAPVVLIHGLRGNTKDTFSVNGDSGIWHQLTQAGYIHDYSIHCCDYDGTKGPSELIANDNYNPVWSSLNSALETYRNNRIECTRADIVAHSMGGLMARKFLQEGLTHTPYGGHNWGYESYRQGMVRRVITVATPHRGSPFAEDLISTSDMNNTARNALNSVLNYAAGMELDANADSAYMDLLPDSQAYGFPEAVPFHSIYGDISTGLTIAEIVASISPVGGLAAAGIRSVFESKFPKQGHDLVVSVQSASSNFNPEYTTKFSDLSVTKYNHLNICKQDDVGKRVADLLKGPSENFQTGGYNQPDIKPVIADMTLPYGVKGSEYSAQMTLSEGGGNTTWTAKSGLPKGLTMTSAGLITGTPTKAGTSKFNVTAQNEAGKNKKKFSITVYELPTIKTKSLKTGKSDKKYKVTLSASGSKPFTWRAEGLPEGLTINPSKGIIEGIAESCVGDFSVTITALNMAGSVSKNFTLTMNGAAPKIKGSLKTGKTFQTYTAKFTASGTNPITWTLSGNLPAGLEFDSDSATISGTPQEPCKKLELILTASNKVKSVSKTLRLTINAAKNRYANSSQPGDNKDAEILTPFTQNDKEITSDYSYGYSHGGINALKISDGCKIIARLPEISVDLPGMYDFEIELSDDVQTDEEMIYIANSSEPSDDDEIAEFYDDSGMEVTKVPQSKKIILSVWLREGIIYAPVVVVKEY